MEKQLKEVKRIQQLAGILKEELDYSSGEYVIDQLKSALQDYYSYTKGDDFQEKVLKFIEGIIRMNQGTPEELSTPPSSM